MVMWMPQGTQSSHTRFAKCRTVCACLAQGIQAVARCTFQSWPNAVHNQRYAKSGSHLHEGHGDCVEGAAGLHNGIMSRQRLELVGRSHKGQPQCRSATASGDVFRETLLLRVDAGPHGGAPLRQLVQPAAAFPPLALFRTCTCGKPVMPFRSVA